MASFTHILLCAGASLLIYFWFGLPLARRIAPPALAVMLAPAMGWAVHGVIALPLLFAAGMSRAAVIAVFALPLAGAAVCLWRDRQGAVALPVTRASALIHALALAGAALLALAVMAAVVPKFSAAGVTLAGPIFDHSKIAMIDEMARLGVPPGNPFFGADGSPARLSYYYLWHFSAAELSVLLNVSGWEADAGLSWFTGFASLIVVIGFAVWLSGRASAALWAIALAATGSVRPLLYAIFGVDRAEAIAGYQSGFGAWLFQTTWAPQHTASAMTALLSVYLLVQTALQPRMLTALLFALTMAAGFESSTWVGGIVFPLAAAPIALVMLARAAPHDRLRIVLHLAFAAGIALLLISLFLYDQLRMTALRGDGSPIAIVPFEILGDNVRDFIGDRLGGFIASAANAAAYWAILLAVEFPAFYIAGLMALFWFLKDRAQPGETRSVVIAFALALAASLCAAWLLLSTLGENNDLGWRAVLPGVLLLMVFAAAGLSRLPLKSRPIIWSAAIVPILLGLPDGARFGYGSFVVKPGPTAKAFAATPSLWQAVRRHTPTDERVANNPAFMERVTPWGVNISWALLADRRSCYAGLALIGPFSAQSHARQEEIDAQFARVFAGQARPGDVEQLATFYHCATAVVVPSDGAWSNDPFAASPFYRLTEGTADWRIYHVTKP
jgi:hypothetical protein